MSKKVIVFILFFIVGLVGGLLLSNLGDNDKNETKNVVSNTSNSVSIVANTASNTTSNTTETKNVTSNNTTKKESKTSNNEISNSVKNNKTDNTQAKNTQKDNNQTKNTDAGLSSYKTVWQYPDSNYPEQEFEVKSISDKEVKFDYTIDGITSFENVSAPINGNTANFDIKNEGDWNIKGTITFSDNKVVFNIKESSTENIPVNSTTFTVKSNKSAY